ncbi:hypothetical protein GALMADRAFT_1025264 [Galerina marginata CBS 339.88]|uniref:Uncharacterized protein n=1 Tax=Galerina marginata (strain CBS 339.88) TaxID=685588 RepID=A0A067SCP8_GALM3|nr:hypothetical protein GALMADRAFT_1025264 [Galerina marginata CBS 339.88]
MCHYESYSFLLSIPTHQKFGGCNAQLSGRRRLLFLVFPWLAPSLWGQAMVYEFQTQPEFSHMVNVYTTAVHTLTTLYFFAHVESELILVGINIDNCTEKRFLFLFFGFRVSINSKDLLAKAFGFELAKKFDQLPIK